jgi:glycosyltransferase involved in cell wall biosynthesis
MRFSIIIPTLNSQQYLFDTLSSIYSQVYKNYEIIVVDGGSSDGTHEIVEFFSSLVTHYIRGTDGSMYEALNKGFARATGDILCYLNSDDLYFSDTLAQALNVFERHRDIKYLVAYGDLIIYDSLGHPLYRHKYPEFFSPAFYTASHSLIGQPSSFWSRSILDVINPMFSTSYRYAGDYHFFQKCSLFATFVKSSKILAGFRIHKNSLSNSGADLAAIEHSKIQRLHGYMPSLPEQIGVAYTMSAYHFLNYSSKLFSTVGLRKSF